MHTKLFIVLCIHLPYYMSMLKQWKIYMNTVETIFCFSKLFFLCAIIMIKYTDTYMFYQTMIITQLHNNSLK